eukprot:jgi/Chlat1/632/Chrsp103S08592
MLLGNSAFNGVPDMSSIANDEVDGKDVGIGPENLKYVVVQSPRDAVVAELQVTQLDKVGELRVREVALEAPTRKTPAMHNSANGRLFVRPLQPLDLQHAPNIRLSAGASDADTASTCRCVDFNNLKLRDAGVSPADTRTA